MSKYQVNNRPTIVLLIGKLMTGMADLMALIGNKTADLNKDTLSVGTDICA